MWFHSFSIQSKITRQGSVTSGLLLWKKFYSSVRWQLSNPSTFDRVVFASFNYILLMPPTFKFVCIDIRATQTAKLSTRFTRTPFPLPLSDIIELFNYWQNIESFWRIWARVGAVVWLNWSWLRSYSDVNIPCMDAPLSKTLVTFSPRTQCPALTFAMEKQRLAIVCESAKLSAQYICWHSALTSNSFVELTRLASVLNILLR